MGHSRLLLTSFTTKLRALEQSSQEAL
ncbi:hypothetical protein PENPOL_c013G03231 [Penicillium polonicum]|uniref:Uncharacterized protein n=1 Tax=Penicillium polonicum TaxID=60169 RepID=A0A1V6NBZ9_PENPO|nr:hypothetical protein PENPOL_c013G03231 [Penicillium polonicum]